MKNRGTILFSVLLFLQIFTVLGLYAASDSLLQLKESYRAWQKQVSLLVAEHALSLAEEQLLLRDLQCVIPIESPNFFLQQPLLWWKSNALCHGEYQGSQYHYVVQSLGYDVCAKIAHQKNIARYYQVTLLVDPGTIILQSTVAKADDSTSACHHAFHLVTAGRQMWQELF